MNNPYKDWPNAFEEGLQKSREGDLNSAVQLLEAAILQDPQDSEVRSPILYSSSFSETVYHSDLSAFTSCWEYKSSNMAFN